MTEPSIIEAAYATLLSTYRSVKGRGPGAILRTEQVRDLTVIEFLGDLLLIVAVDSDGGIGPKPHDVVQTSGYVCGRFATRVPLMEIVASGALPIAAFDVLAVEMDPSGKEIIRGVRDELTSMGLPADFPLSGSTEDNVPTSQTGLGVMIIGLVEKIHFRPGRAQTGDLVYCVGIPKSGPRHIVVLDDPEIADAAAVLAASTVPGVHDILPVGSRGTGYEATQLALAASREFAFDRYCTLDAGASAGPSTCFLVSGVEGIGETLREVTGKPVTIIGRIA